MSNTTRLSGTDLGKGERGVQRLAALKSIALERGCIWGSQPSIGRLLVALADEHIAETSRMREQWSTDGTAVKIYGQISPHPIIATASAVAHFGDTETTFHQIHQLRRKNLLPRPEDSEAHPFSMTDINLALENKRLGYRHWQYGTLYPTVNEYIRGYYHIEGEFAVFRDNTRVKM